jgi:hypothetical protein
MNEIIETKNVALPQGGALEIQLTQKMIDLIKAQFSLMPEESINDNHIKMFMLGTLKNAIENAEKDCI